MLNPHQLPALRVLLPFITGILIAYGFDPGWFYPSILFGCFLSIFLFTAFANSLFKTELPAKLSAALLFAAMGYLACWFKQELHAADHFSKAAKLEESKFICEITDAPQLKENWVKVPSRVTHLVNDGGNSQATSGNILIYLARDSSSERISYGDVILLSKAPQAVRKNTNPDAFDYSRYLHFQNIHFQSFARNGDWKLLGSGKGNPILAFSYQSQKRLVRILRKHLPTQDEFAVGSALLLGYRDEISDELRDAYAQTGAMHVLAVSGLHVGIIFVLLTFLFHKIESRSRVVVLLKTGAVLTGIWGFALVTGASPSVMRAATMFSLLAMGQALQRSGAIYNTLMVSAFILLLINPLWLASVGFQLSYLAVFGIVYFQRRFERMIWVPKGFLRKIWTLVTVSLAAQLTTGPISIFYFRQFPVFFWLSSLFLVPAAALLMSGGLLLMMLEWCAPGIAFYIGKTLWAAIWLCNQLVYAIQSVPGALVEDLFLTGSQTILLYMILLTAMVFISHKHKRSLIVSSAMGLAFFATTSFRSISNSEKLEVVVFDQYKSTVIEFYHNKQCFRIASEGIDYKSLGFVVKGHHQRLGIHETFDISGTAAASKDSILLKKGNRILFGGLRILHLNEKSRARPSAPLEVDLIIVSDNQGYLLKKLLQSITCKMVVFDTSNKVYRIGKYTQLLDNLGIKHHVVANLGAFQKAWELE